MSYTLPKLSYAYDALEPYIDAATMELHHTKHHQTYIDTVNAALAPYPDFADKKIETLLRDLDVLPDAIRTIVRNHGGGHANHTAFWEWMTPFSRGEPSGQLRIAIERQFGSFDAFRSAFSDAAKKQFGSGWAWLVINPAGTLSIMATANQDSPLSQKCEPILGVDVWEHAYYLHYQNRRADYLAAWWHVVNWERVTELYNTHSS